MIDNINVSVLTSILNTDIQFEHKNTGNNFSAKLVDVQEGAGGGDKWVSFNFTFDAGEGKNVGLVEGEYKLTHPSFGEATLFGSPNSPSELEFCCNYERKYERAVPVSVA